VVAETVQRACDALHWPLVKYLALRPLVKFSYLPGQKAIRFCNFADRQERIANGMCAFDIAASVGWRQVEQSLQDYGLLPRGFFESPDSHFRKMRADILMSAEHFPIGRSAKNPRTPVPS
jgi:hypothetical protein